MSYHYFQSDYLFDGKKFLNADTILITDKEGIIIDIVASSDLAQEKITHLEGILCPGFVNAHCHLELSDLKDRIKAHTGLPEFLISVIQRRYLREKASIEKGVCRAIQDMKERGIAAIGDICNTADALAIKLLFKEVYFHNFIEVVGMDAQMSAEKAALFNAVFHRYKAQEHHRLTTTYAAHAPYSVSAAVFAYLQPRINNKICSIHMQECAAENEFYEQKKGDFVTFYEALSLDYKHFIPTGKNSLLSVYPYLSETKKLLCVHNVAATPTALHALPEAARHKIYFCLCPKANIYIQNTLPQQNFIYRRDLRFCIGTDSLAANDKLCILSELQCLQQHFPLLSTAQLLSWATSGGAEALDIQERYGVFKKGAQPGLVQLPQATPQSLIPASPKVIF